MLVADVRIVSGVPGWNAATQLRINSGVQILKPTRWSAVAEAFRDREKVIERQRREGRPLRPGVSPAREVGGIYPPKADWRRPSAEELDRLLGVTDGGDLHSTVQLLSVPDELIALARRLSAPHIAAGRYEFDKGLMDIAGADLAPLVKLTDEWLARTMFKHAGWAMFSIRVGTAGRLMASGFEGLHIDLYGPVVRDQLGQPYNGSRLALNLGDETRYVVFVNQRLATIMRNHPEIQDIAERREAIAAALQECGAQGMIANAFLESFPDYPVVRLTIEPGQGYFAPTPAMLHDGYLAGKKDQDLMLFASHKGDQNGFPWQKPEFLKSWAALCAEASFGQGSHLPCQAALVQD